MRAKSSRFYVTKTRDKAAALSVAEKALERHGSPRAITTDGLRSYKAAMSEIGTPINKRSAVEPTTAVENRISPFDDGRGQS